ncbi:MAG TPA: DNA repair protein RadA [Acidobacteriota bacterium]|nr:DNA repair protein RadA [Acidobacteriota bacterium]
MNKSLTVYECRSCGYNSPKWLGRCPDCGDWNSFVEEKRMKSREGSSKSREQAKAVRLTEVSTEAEPRIDSHNPEFNRALGGGIVPGSLILLGGEPGAGKSTLLLQVAQSIHREGFRVLYASGEESLQQIKMRADRIDALQTSGGGAAGDDIYLLTESNLEIILAAAEDVRPAAIIVDSVQTMFSESLESAPGSVSQVRHVAMQFLTLAKKRNIPVFLVGHVTKEGSIAGPKVMEHIVDVVLYFEGDGRQNHRIIRAVKNRFGAANEVGIFEMTSRGLIPAANPSSLFLMERENISAGSSVVCALEGTRPLLVEIQALVVATQYSTARRVATGVGYNRISVLVAMLEKRLGIHMTGSDIYVNTAGGMEIDEPGADLGIFAAILSSLRNHPLPADTVLLGELSLSGDIRPVSQAHLRVREAAAMGFRKCVIPNGNLPLVDPVDDIALLPVKNVGGLYDILFP